jgi:hypothetical protein
MRKITLFAAAVAALALIGVDAWLSVRTLTSGALAGSTSNPLIGTTGAKASPISHDNDDLLLSH